MNNIQIKGVDITLSQVVLEDVQYLKQHLDNFLVSSDQTLTENLIKETEFFLEQTKDSSKTYQERYVVFNQLTKSWFDACNHYKNTPAAIDFIRSIDYLNNYFAEATQLENQVKIDSSSRPWWEQITGTFADNSAYDEAMRLGREYRHSISPGSTELSDV